MHAINAQPAPARPTPNSKPTNLTCRHRANRVRRYARNPVIIGALGWPA